MVRGEGLRLSLLDHWMNPTDDSVEYFADFSFVVRADMMRQDSVYTDLTLTFDCEKNTVRVTAADFLDLTFSMQHTDHPNGLCYLHMQSAAKENDVFGSLIGKISCRAL